MALQHRQLSQGLAPTGSASHPVTGPSTFRGHGEHMESWRLTPAGSGQVSTSKQLAATLDLSWQSIAWWLLVLPLVPFTAYTAVFLLGNEQMISTMTAGFLDKASNAGHHILNNMPLWRLHSACSILYCCTTPVQFSQSFRKRSPAVHRLSGYIFLLSGTTLAMSGLIMAPRSEFPGFIPPSWALASVWMTCAGFALWEIRRKRISKHKEWMLRALAAGYAPVLTRLMIAWVHQATGLSHLASGAPGLWLALFVALATAEIYVRRVR